MRHARRVARLAVALALAAVVPACGPDVHSASGVVRDVFPDRGQVVIEHQAIPGFMDAMTMSFDVADPALLEGVAVGQEVAFEIAVTPKTIRVVGLRVTGQGDGRSPDAARARLAAERRPAPAFALVDQTGSARTLADLRGRAVVLDFVFTHCPGPCPILTSSHVTLQRMLPPDVRTRTHFVSISLDPERDTPELLEAYASARGADLSDWWFLTGPPGDVDQVLRSYGVGAVPQADGDIQHTVATFLIDPDGHIAKTYLGLEHDPQDLLLDIRALL